MKTELRAAKHSQLPGAVVIELWFDGEFIGEVVGADGPGIRVLSKYHRVTTEIDPLVTEVKLLVR